MNPFFYVGMLAGGDSRRWFGFPKAAYVLSGKAMVHHVIDRLSNYPFLGLCVRQDQLSWANELGIKLVIEQQSVGSGPLKGIYELLLVLPNNVDWLLVLPCDMPYLSVEVVQLLSNTVLTTKKSAVVLANAQGSHTAVAFFHRNSLSVLANLLYEGNYRLGEAYKLLDADYVYWQGNDAILRNINCPEDIPCS